MANEHPLATRSEEIRLDSDGFDVFVEGRHSFRVDWHDVIGIAAFKRDLFTVDEICLTFRDSSDRNDKIVAESMAGYKALTREIEDRYPDGGQSWWGRVAWPTFSTCWTVVWGDHPEPAECPSCGMNIAGVMSDQCPNCTAILATGSCPDCRGRGEFPEVWWKRLSYIGLVAGAATMFAAYLYPRSQWFRDHDVRSLGLVFLVPAAILFVVSLRDRPWPCTRCDGTGWWDPRGRSMRQIPEQQ